MKIPTKANRSPLTLALYAVAKKRGYNTDTFENRNLIKLREYLAGLPKGYENFAMGNFARDENDPSVIKEGDCGTPACVVGHGPSAGIDISEYIIDGEIRWVKYSQKLLSFTDFSDGGPWEFLFSGNWPDSIALALERMDYWLVNQKVPEWYTDETDKEIDCMDDEEAWDYLLEIGGTELPNPHN